MDDKAPSYEFVVTINMPHRITSFRLIWLSYALLMKLSCSAIYRMKSFLNSLYRKLYAFSEKEAFKHAIPLRRSFGFKASNKF